MLNERKALGDVSDYSEPVLQIIHQDSNESIKILRDNIVALNTGLALLIGFNATLLSFFLRIPKLTSLENLYLITTQFKQENIFPSYFLEASIFLISSKALGAILVGLSIVLAILSILPSPSKFVLSPQKMLDQGKRCPESEFRLKIIRIRHESIQQLEAKIQQKAFGLRASLIALALAATFILILIILDTWTTFE